MIAILENKSNGDCEKVYNSDCDAGYVRNKLTGNCDEIRYNPSTGEMLVPHSKVHISKRYMEIDVKDGKVYNTRKNKYETVFMNKETKRLNKY